MRRSVQTAVMYEAHRALQSKLSSLRPFQRKIALINVSNDLVDTLDFIPQFHREQIMFRTASGRLPLSPDLAWRRMKLIDREIMKHVVPQMEPFIDPDKTHQQACDDYIQHQYELVSGTKDKPHPPLWEHSHLNVFLAYRMYYNGVSVHETLPPSRPPREVIVPTKKPLPGSDPMAMGSDDDEAGLKRFAADISSADPVDPEERRKVLKEVRDHLEILKEFEGIVSDEELTKRKRELFKSLPPAPPVGSGGGGSAYTTPRGGAVGGGRPTKKAKVAAEAPPSSTATPPPPPKESDPKEEEEEGVDEEDE